MSLSVVINFVLYELAWFVSVLSAANHQPWISVIGVAVILIWHLTQAKHAAPELILLLITLLIGGMFDQAMLNSGLITYETHGWSNNFVPVWILTLWAGFVTLLNISLRWLRGRWLLAIVLGAIGGPLAYMAAAIFGAVTLNASYSSYLALSIGWAILTPLLLTLSKKFDGFKVHV